MKSKYGIIRNALVWGYSFTVSGKHKVSTIVLRLEEERVNGFGLLGAGVMRDMVLIYLGTIIFSRKTVESSLG